jgi:hypothetical protein
MSRNKAPLENKSYYGGIYSYFKQQKLTRAKESDQTQSNKGN